MDALETGSEKAGSAGRPVAVVSQRTHRVLLVDDKADIRLLLATRLGLDPGLWVAGEAADGSEAIARARELQPDVIILDLEMPVMDGLAVIPILRTVDPTMRILVYTGSAKFADQKLTGAAKPDGFVVKGADLRLLMRELKSVLAEQPGDILTCDLGLVPLQQAVNAFDGWVGFNIRIREAMAESISVSSHEFDRRETDLMALIGIFIAIGDSLVRAAQANARDVQLQIKTRRSVGQAAHRALSEIEIDNAVQFHEKWKYEMPPQAQEALKQLRERLLDRLPVG
ncbi:MAG: response regulator [Actinomycetota bacterium]|nr:response regulator [Actinomycetota bacterium]